MEDFLLDLLNGIVKIDFKLVLNIFLVGLVLFWIAVVSWVWSDSGERTTSRSARIGYVLLVAILNVFGLLIYLLIRPSETIEAIYWGDLERRYLKYETAELGDCPKCGCQLFPGYIFCPECGYELKVKCSKCDVYVDKNDKYCAFCRNQINTRKKTEETPTVEVMEKQIQESKEEAREVVESDKTRYKTRKNLVKKGAKRMGRIYNEFVDGISKKIVDGVEKANTKKGEEKPKAQKENKPVKKTSKSKSKKKSKRKSKKK
jgi:hypothetical protein